MCFITPQTMQDKLSESPRCNDMVADLHFLWFFGTAIQCEIAWHFFEKRSESRSHFQCKNISILTGVQP